VQVNIVITATTTAGKKKTTTVSYVNPQAANSKLAALAVALNAFTTNSYVSASKETKGEVL